MNRVFPFMLNALILAGLGHSLAVAADATKHPGAGIDAESAASAKYANVPLESLIERVQADKGGQSEYAYGAALAKKAPVDSREINLVLDRLDKYGKYGEPDQFRGYLTRALGNVTNPALASEFRKRIRKGKFATRLVAIEQVARLHDRDSVPDLIELVDGFSKTKARLEGTDVVLRFEAAKALGEIHDDRAIPSLMKQLGEMQGADESALARFGKKVSPQLLEIVRDSADEERRRAAGRAVAAMQDKELIPEMWKSSQDEKDKARFVGLHFLLGTTDDKTHPSRDDVREYVLNNTSKHRAFQTMAVEIAVKKKDADYLLSVARNEKVDSGTRTGAIITLTELRATSAVPGLEELLKDPNREVRLLAARALKIISGKDYQPQ